MTWWSCGAGVLSDDPLFFLLNSYTTGLSPSVMEYILGVTVETLPGQGVLLGDRASGHPERICSAVRQHRHLGKIKGKPRGKLRKTELPFFICRLLHRKKGERI